MLRAGIIGAGRIAWAYDGGSWSGEGASVTLASCLDRHPGVALVAVHEPVEAARRAFDRGYLGPRPVAVHGRLESFLAEGLDLVMIASPSAMHAAHVHACFDTGVPRLWIEKPVTLTMHDYDALQARFEALATPPRTCVNYTRRCLPQLAHMKAHLEGADRADGTVSIAVAYSRGLDVNGVHLLDLLGCLTGEPAVPPLDQVEGASGSDPCFGLRIGGIPIRVTGHDLPYHLIELTITDARGRLSLVRGGRSLVWEPVEPTPLYPGFFQLAAAREVPGLGCGETALREATYRMLCALLDERRSPPSTLQTARFAQAMLERVRRAPGVPA